MKNGFSLVEATIAMALLLVVVAAFLPLMDPVRGILHAQLDAVEQQQRLRSITEAITRDLAMAGAGTGRHFPAVLPRRRGAMWPDPPGTASNDRISILYAPAGAPETTLSAATGVEPTIPLNAVPHCPAHDPLCGFTAGSLGLVFDESGAYETFRILAVQAAPPALIRADGSWLATYAAGARITQVVSATYWLQRDPRTGSSDLMTYDGDRSGLPVADDVTDLRFEYYDATSTEAPALGGRPLDPALFKDGPWLPNAEAPERFDQDLLRVRSVRVSVAVTSFSNFIRAPQRRRQISFFVTPRNLGFAS